MSQALADADRRALSAGVELSDLQRQLAEARGERDASQVRSLPQCWAGAAQRSSLTSHRLVVAQHFCAVCLLAQCRVVQGQLNPTATALSVATVS